MVSLLYYRDWVERTTLSLTVDVPGTMSLDERSIDVEVATKALESLLSKCVEASGHFAGDLVHEQPIGKKYSYCSQSGAYIKFGGFFVEEYGLYMPAKDVMVIESNGTDPSYHKLSGEVYSYRHSYQAPIFPTPM